MPRAGDSGILDCLSPCFQGPLSVMDFGKQDWGSFAFLKMAIDSVNILFLLIFSVLFFVGMSRGERNHSRCARWNLSNVVVSICCMLISIAYFGVGSWDLLEGTRGPVTVSWQFCIFRGILWFSLALSLIVQGLKQFRVLMATWCTSFFVLVSVLDIELLLKHELHIFDVVQWLVNGLLVACAVNQLRHAPVECTETDSASEPLLSGKTTGTSVHLKRNILNKMTFSWINPLLLLGFSKPLALEDIPSVFREDEAELAYKKFSESWNTLMEAGHSRKGKNLVTTVLAMVYSREMLCVAILALLRTVTVVASPLLLYAFVAYSNSNEQNLDRGLLLLGCLVMVKVIESLSHRQWAFYARRSGLRIRSALMVAVYQKQLKLSTLGKKMHSTGEVVNYIMVDAYRMGELAWWFHSSWSLPLQLILSICVLVGVLGLCAIPAVVPLVICGILNIPFAKKLQTFQAKSMAVQDKRLRLTSEILSGMKIIKLQSWEEHFLKLINSLRDEEVKLLRNVQQYRANSTALFWFSPTMISSLAFWGCSYFRGEPLDAVTTFTILAALEVVAEPVVLLPNAISSMIQIKVSFDRINKFLLEDKFAFDTHDRKQDVNHQGIRLEVRDGNFSWTSETALLTLRNLFLKVQNGEKVAICGPVGAGKSSLLHAILGEIPKVSGQMNVCGSIAYVSQSAWIQSGTVRDNILFGSSMDKDRYERAIIACALDKDISNFSHGDLTVIGQRGINLSGGQKQRIQLARAVYSDADLYLLDDPFSAVDAHTAATLFKDCVMTSLAKKTMILVTHQVEFLSQVDQIWVMRNGELAQRGTYDKLLKAGRTFEQLVNAHNKAATEVGNAYTEGKRDPKNETTDHHIDDIDCTASHTEENNLVKCSDGQITEDEKTETGDAGWKPYLDYVTVSKAQIVLCLSVISQCLFVAFQSASRYWLAYAVELPNMNIGILIAVYAGLSTLSIVFIHLRSLFTVAKGLKASKAFFEGFMNSLFTAPMFYFDSTPIGRILTRLSSDLSILDFEMPFEIAFVVAGGTVLFGMVLIMSLITWQVLVLGILTLVMGKYFQDKYLASAREMIRLNGTTKAPIMNYAAETSQGVISIRAFRKADQLFRNYLKLVDTDAKLFFYSNAAMEWLTFRIEALQNMTLFTVAFLFILLPKGYVSPGFVGLSLSYAMVLKNTHVFMIQYYCKIANHIISVERIKQYMHINPEPQAIVPGNRPPSFWPPKGTIELQDLKIQYQPNAPLVLKGITCTFEGGRRVGVVGRTGSGKTTLIGALFRLVEPHSGGICIDGIDICSIGLKDLRTKLSIIPQEPTLFRGSIRSNLDPLKLYSDAEIWEALAKCQLKHTISALPKQLDSSVGDEGENWSMGQRQLLCLGRVILKRNKILVLDEATASIDSATDAILQKIIREEFSECTVITVAHRVPTVIDSDMVMVLSYGEMLEYDEPSQLMQRNSAFAKLVAEYWSSCRRGSDPSSI